MMNGNNNFNKIKDLFNSIEIGKFNYNKEVRNIQCNGSPFIYESCSESTYGNIEMTIGNKTVLQFREIIDKMEKLGRTEMICHFANMVFCFTFICRSPLYIESNYFIIQAFDGQQIFEGIRIV